LAGTVRGQTFTISGDACAGHSMQETEERECAFERTWFFHLGARSGPSPAYVQQPALVGNGLVRLGGEVSLHGEVSLLGRAGHALLGLG